MASSDSSDDEKSSMSSSWSGSGSSSPASHWSMWPSHENTLSTGPLRDIVVDRSMSLWVRLSREVWSDDVWCWMVVWIEEARSVDVVQVIGW